MMVIPDYNWVKTVDRRGHDGRRRSREGDPHISGTETVLSARSAFTAGPIPDRPTGRNHGVVRGTSERYDVVVVGAGQAGLAVSGELTGRGVPHIVLERGRLGQTWRDRWDSFCLVTPNWSVQLPGHPYDGDDPDAFLPRDEIVAYLERYAVACSAPVTEKVEVTALDRTDDGSYRLTTSAGDLFATAVVLATGAYQRPHRPPAVASLAERIPVLDLDRYGNPDALPAGGVLVIGSGQSGCQLAEELHDAGREVFLACGKAPWAPRRIGGRDVFSWYVTTGFADQGFDKLPSPAARLGANPQLTGHGGGHDLNCRTLHAAGVTLLGRLRQADDHRAWFADDLADSVAAGDGFYRQFRELVRTWCAANAAPPPDLPDPPPFRAEPPAEVPLARLGSAVLTAGFRPDYARWVHLPAFDDMGFPIQRDGASRDFPGLYFVGVHFLRTRKSSLLVGVGEDAAIVADAVARRAG
jgi:putative flavoprotein involved in K+ transport